MADIRWVTKDFAVAPQLSEDDFAELRAQGFTTVIGNRPDGESPGEMQRAAAETAARAAGVAYVYAPFSGPPPPEAIDAVIKAKGQTVLAYCRSGTRSITAWAIAQAKSGALGPDAIVEAARTAGYDLHNMKEFLRSVSPG
jgi:sulfide:quinone oxidoreductase